MPNRTTTAGAAIELLRTKGWALGPTIEADRWRSEVRRLAREGDLKVATGITDAGLPWAARNDLTPQEETDLRTPWGLMRVQARTYFTQYPPPFVDEVADEVHERATLEDVTGLTAEELAQDLAGMIMFLAVPSATGERTPLDHAVAEANGDQLVVTLQDGRTFRLDIELVEDDLG